MSKSITKVKDLKPGMENITTAVRVLENYGTRTVDTKAGTRTLGEYMVGDETGKVKLVVWGFKASSLSVGEVVEVRNAWVTVFRGEVQLNAGRNSSIEKLSNDAVPPAENIPNDVPRPSEAGRRAPPRGLRSRKFGGRGRGRRDLK